MAITPAMLKFSAELLDLASDEFSNNGCNDFYLKDTPENRELVTALQTEERWDEPETLNLREGKIITQDWCLMRFLARKMRE